jgi:thiosulfate sulfurtransferase
MTFRHLDIKGLKSLMQEDPDLRIFDTRDPGSYAAGHITNAMTLNNDTMQQLLDATTFESNIVVCCYHGVSSQSVATWLAEQGFDNVYSLIGGYAAWSAQN